MRRWLTLLLGLALGLVVYIVAVPLFERVAPRSWVRAYARFANPFFEPWTGLIWGWAVIETTGRTSGQPRRTPIGGRLRGNTYWLVAAERGRSHYLKNIEANPRVRLRVHGSWRTGKAHVLTEDSPP
jgi:deazaflavin-dependent oxidoreductase (nitroreductase family)